MKPIVMFLAVCWAVSILCCSREDGLPDPPVQMLVPCNPDADAADPLACPTQVSTPSQDGGLADHY